VRMIARYRRRGQCMGNHTGICTRGGAIGPRASPTFFVVFVWVGPLVIFSWVQ